VPLPMPPESFLVVYLKGRTLTLSRIVRSHHTVGCRLAANGS
jgi:hypothetical protein